MLVQIEYLVCKNHHDPEKDTCMCDAAQRWGSRHRIHQCESHWESIGWTNPVAIHCYSRTSGTHYSWFLGHGLENELPTHHDADWFCWGRHTGAFFSFFSSSNCKIPISDALNPGLRIGSASLPRKSSSRLIVKHNKHCTLEICSKESLCNSKIECHSTFKLCIISLVKISQCCVQCKWCHSSVSWVLFGISTLLECQIEASYFNGVLIFVSLFLCSMSIATHRNASTAVLEYASLLPEMYYALHCVWGCLL